MWAAGVLPVSVGPDGTPVVLLGRDARSKGGRWSDFAGGAEPGDASPRDTALRELWEETAGAVRLPDLDPSRSLVLRDTTPSGKDLTRYVVPVPFDAAIPQRFDRDRCKNFEKVALAWFPLSALPPMRRVFAIQMDRDARRIMTFVLDAQKHAPTWT